MHRSEFDIKFDACAWQGNIPPVAVYNPRPSSNRSVDELRREILTSKKGNFSWATFCLCAPLAGLALHLLVPLGMSEVAQASFAFVGGSCVGGLVGRFGSDVVHLFADLL